MFFEMGRQLSYNDPKVQQTYTSMSYCARILDQIMCVSWPKGLVSYVRLILTASKDRLV